MSILSTIRLVLWGAAIVCACITVGLASNIIALEAQDSINVSTWAALTLASGALTLFTLPVFIAVDQTRKGAFTSMIIVEMVTLTILWILWAVAAGLTTEAYNASLCSFHYLDSTSTSNSVCQQFQSVEAFCWLAFFAMLVYAFILLVFTMIAHNRGHHVVWLQSIKQTNFFAAPINAPEDSDAEKAAGGAPQMAAPQMQYQFPPNMGTPGMPMQGMPMQGMPLQGMPMMGMPLQGMPMQGMPMQGVPMQGVPLGTPGQPMQPLYPQTTGSPAPQQPVYPQTTGTPVPQQPVYPQTTGTLVAQQDTGFTGQAGAGQF